MACQTQIKDQGSRIKDYILNLKSKVINHEIENNVKRVIISDKKYDNHDALPKRQKIKPLIKRKTASAIKKIGSTEVDSDEKEQVMSRRHAAWISNLRVQFVY